MRRATLRRIRTAAKWGFTALAVLTACGWVATRWIGVWLGTGGAFYAAARYGALELGVSSRAAAIIPVGPSIEHYHDLAGWRMGFSGRWTDAHHFNLVLPLWAPLAGVAMVAGAVWWLDRRATRRENVGLCPSCGYDRRGLVVGAPCPECGAKGNAP